MISLLGFIFHFHARFRLYHCAILSYAWAARRIFASDQGGPMICRPMGREFVVNPQGMDMAGRPVRLKGAVNRVSKDACSTAFGPTMRGAGTGVVGVNRRS